MCKRKREGSRCAADTRRDVAAARAVLESARARRDPDELQAVHAIWREALVEHAATKMGQREVLDKAESFIQEGNERRAQFFQQIADDGELRRLITRRVRENMLDELEAKGRKNRPHDLYGVTPSALDNAYPFHVVYSSEWDGMMSGWKVHITTFNTEEAWDAWTRIADVVEDHGLVAKLAGAQTHKDWGLGYQQGKGVTVYFPHRDTVEEDLYAIVNAMDDWQHEDPPIGDAKVGQGIGLRWEFGGNDFERDLPQREYEQRYVSAGHNFRAPESALKLLGSLAPEFATV